METGLTKNQIIQELTRSSHGDLKAFMPIATIAARSDPEFLAHMIAWNQANGSVKDSKIAIPVATLAALSNVDKENSRYVLVENSLAHLALQDPRQFAKAVKFVFDTPETKGHRQAVRRLVRRYLEYREQSFGLWEPAIVQHRKSMEYLYKKFHIPIGGKKGSLMDQILSKGILPKGTTLELVSRLKHMSAKEALGQIQGRDIPYLVVAPNLGPKLKDTDAMLALITSMSSTELITNAKMLEKWGVKKDPALRAAFQEGLKRAAVEAPRQSLLKATVAAKAVGGSIGKQLRATQEAQLKTVGGVKGRWGIFGDRSQSMSEAIALARFIAGNLARRSEEAHLVFFNTSPFYKNVTGWTLEQIEQETALITADGGTSPGVALDYLLQRGIEIDGIAITTDGGERHAPSFIDIWRKYCKRFDKEPTLYVFEVKGSDPNWLSQRLAAEGIGHELFNLRGGVDYNSIENMIKTLNTRRWTLLDQIMETPLLTLDQVFTTEAEKEKEKSYETGHLASLA